jgi:hypothetical protein
LKVILGSGADGTSPMTVPSDSIFIKIKSLVIPVFNTICIKNLPVLVPNRFLIKLSESLELRMSCWLWYEIVIPSASNKILLHTRASSSS